MNLSKKRLIILSTKAEEIVYYFGFNARFYNHLVVGSVTLRSGIKKRFEIKQQNYWSGLLTGTVASYSIAYATNETGYKVIDVQN